MRRVFATLSVLAVLAGLGACSAIVAPDTGKLGNPPPLPCVPGTVNENCACADGRTGTQTCNEQERYDACVCHGPGGSAGTGAGGN